MRPSRTRLDARIFLYLTPLMWGITFPSAKLALGELEIGPFMFWTRLLGFLAIAITVPFIARGRITLVSLRGFLGPGFFLGALIFGGYLFQTWGTSLTTATNAGLITGMYVVLTPLAMFAVFRQAPGRGAWAGVGLAVVGLFLLSAPSISRLSAPGLGDLLVLVGTLGWTAHVISIGRMADRFDPALIAVVQMGATALFQLVFTLVAGQGLDTQGSLHVWHLLLITGIVGTGLGYTFQVLAQKEITASRAAIVLAGESLVAAVSSAIWVGDRLRPHQLVGALLMVGAMVISELGARRPAQALLEPGSAP
ncbi:MAG: DMT family transporter [Actinomycetota bacterium]